MIIKIIKKEKNTNLFCINFVVVVIFSGFISNENIQISSDIVKIISKNFYIIFKKYKIFDNNIIKICFI
jgi:hypothetical protein